MGRTWRPYNVGPYHLGSLHNQEVGQYEAVVRYRGKDGKPKRQRLGAFTEAEGRRALDEWVALRGVVQKALESPFVEDIWQLYIADRAKDGKKMRPFHESWNALQSRFAKMRVSEITDDVCRDYARQRLDRGRIIRTKDGTERRVDISIGTVWTELLRLRSCINWAAERHHIKYKKHIWVPTKPKSRQDILTPEQFRALIDACTEDHTRLFCMIAITTAARSGAILELTWDRVNFKDKEMDFRAPTINVNPISKAAQKTRVVGYMTAEVEVELIEAHRKRGHDTSHVISYNFAPVACIRKSFMAAAKRAGLPPSITPHILRHTALTWLDQAGIPVERISRLAGHSRSSITEMVYIKTQMAQVRGASETLGRIVAGTPSRNRLQIEDLPPEDA